MSEPVFFVSHFRIKEGQLDFVRQLTSDGAARLQAEKPRTVLFLCYLDADDETVSFLHAFADAESMDVHFGMTLLPEFYLLKGDLLLGLPQSNRAAAEPSYQRAFDIAQHLDARMPRLRAGVRLCAMRQNGDNSAQSLRTLRAVYDTFTEGFTTTDLIEATQLLASRDNRAR